MVILPILAFLCCWTAAYLNNRDWRASFMTAATLWAVWVAVTTETLSLGSWISRYGIAASWLIATAVAWFFVIRRQQAGSLFSRHALGQSEATKRSGTEWILLAAIAVILSLTAVVAIVAAPDSWDAMQYSMPRIVMWLQNHSVRMYPTIDYQQLTMSPWADYAMMHLMALQGSDRFANLVAWLAFAGSVIGVSLVGRELGASPRAQILASLLCATIPSAILFASSPKPDETISFWVVASHRSIFCFGGDLHPLGQPQSWPGRQLG